ncbi:MAG TPA: hypothetical protein VEO94_07985 [Candidatus Dormibacteraeota bacterium]|nr:hypothetical protein [Candidatus Dormibacteraeota bacterium]
MNRVPEPGRLTRRALVCLAALLLGLRGARAQPGPEPEKLNLFQMIARSELVALVRVRSGSLKYAIVEVQEALKGTAALPTLRIAFRDFNFTRRAGEDLIIFPDGQQEILFLVPYGRQVRRKKARLKNRDLFTLFHGREGRITLPAEGPETILGAIRRLAEVCGRDPASQIDALKSFLEGDNPFLTESSLQEIERLRAGDPASFPRLLLLLNSRSMTLRTGSLRVLGQVFSTGRLADEALDGARAALAAVLERARNDPDESVRVQAVAAVAAWPNRAEVEQELKAIAGTDSAQAVRYEAERALFERR